MIKLRPKTLRRLPVLIIACLLLAGGLVSLYRRGAQRTRDELAQLHPPEP